MTSKLKYGQTDFDFDDGVLVTAPKQIISIEKIENIKLIGRKLIFHPDFLQGYPLAKTIHNYSFLIQLIKHCFFLIKKKKLF
jgi:hypothetical protein